MTATIHGFGNALKAGAWENGNSKIVGNPRLILWAADEALSWNKFCQGPKEIGAVKITPIKEVLNDSGSFFDGPYDLVCTVIDSIESVTNLFFNSGKTKSEKLCALSKNVFGVISTGAKTTLFLHGRRAIRLPSEQIVPTKVTACAASIVRSSISIGQDVLVKNSEEKPSVDANILSARAGKKVIEIARSISSIVLQALCIVKFTTSVAIPSVAFLTLTTSMLIMTLATKVLNTSDKPAEKPAA